MDHGQKIAEDTPQEALNDQRVIDAYLGARVQRAS
jgi:ABC-type branched-subunit amino acid transport system ATPase component